MEIEETRDVEIPLLSNILHEMVIEETKHDRNFNDQLLTIENLNEIPNIVNEFSSETASSESSDSVEPVEWIALQEDEIEPDLVEQFISPVDSSSKNDYIDSIGDPSLATTIKSFNALFPSEFFDFTVFQTNHYAKMKLESRYVSKSKEQKKI